MGPQGLKEVADASANLAHYFKKQVSNLSGYKVMLDKQPVFHEVLVECPDSPEQLLKHLEERGIIGGYAVEKDYPEYRNCLLFCFTEANGKAAVDELLGALQHAHRPLEGAIA